MLHHLVLGFPGINDGFFNISYILQQLANGLSNGAIYALVAVTVVIIYKTTGHLNFAQGEMAMFSTFLVFALTAQTGGDNVHGAFLGINVWIALVIVVLVSMAFGAGMERFLIRPVEKKSTLAPVIVSLGMFFVLNALAAVIWGTENRSPVPAPFPSGLADKFDILDGPPKFFLTYKAIGIWVTVGVIVLLLTLMLQKTKLGLGYRAVASNRESAELVGIPVGRMLMFGWALAAGIGAIAGAMTAQYLGRLDFNVMAGILLYGFAAACLGGFDSLKGAVIGGIIVGEAEALLPSLFSFIGSELGLAVALLVILVVLSFRPQGLFGSKRVEARMSKPKVIIRGTPPHRAYQLIGWAIAVAAVLYVVYGMQDYLVIKVSLAVSFGLAVLGLNLVTGLTGQVSLGHSAFFGIGAYTTAILMADSSWPFLATVPVAGLIGGVVGFLVGLPTLRIKGLYLALVTLAIAVVFPTLVKKVDSEGWINTGGANGKTIDSVGRWRAPSWVPGDVTSNGWRFLVIVVITAVMFVLASNLIRSRPGRGMLAIRNNEVGAAVSGVWPAGYKTGAFGYSAIYAAVAGSLYTLAVGTVSPDAFGLTLSIQFIAGLVVGGIATLSGSILGGLIIEFLPYYSSEWLEDRGANVLLGLVLIGVMFIAPGGIMWAVRKLRSRFVVFVPRLPEISPTQWSVVETTPAVPVTAASVPDRQGGDA